MTTVNSNASAANSIQEYQHLSDKQITDYEMDFILIQSLDTIDSSIARELQILKRDLYSLQEKYVNLSTCKCNSGCHSTLILPLMAPPPPPPPPPPSTSLPILSNLQVKGSKGSPTFKRKQCLKSEGSLMNELRDAIQDSYNLRRLTPTINTSDTLKDKSDDNSFTILSPVKSKGKNLNGNNNPNRSYGFDISVECLRSTIASLNHVPPIIPYNELPPAPPPDDALVTPVLLKAAMLKLKHFEEEEEFVFLDDLEDDDNLDVDTYDDYDNYASDDDDILDHGVDDSGYDQDADEYDSC